MSPSSGARLAAAIVVIVLLNLVLVLVGTATEPGTPPASSAASTEDEGLSGYARLLERAGHTVVVTSDRLTPDELDPRATLVVSDPGFVEGGEIQAIVGFTERGGRVVLAGRTTQRIVGQLGAAEDLHWEAVPSADVKGQAVVPTPEVDTTNEVVGGAGVWRNVGGALPIVVTEDGGAMAFVDVRGDGEYVVLSDSGPLQNGRLDDADNASFGLGIAGAPTRPVIFIEPRTGPTGLGAIPVRWRLSGALLVAAVVLAQWSAGKRPIVPSPAPLRGAARVDYANALGELLAKSTTQKGSPR